ncbi:uncharacterized protein conserved in bacteria [Hahella chejuensis KCTC 2396]|uniref:Uncharacterized protein conserved in bacteria n=1 Tax=Hahella chejuensis (strain KCTC 2396) TaxID=349521 RepID=Q2SCG4_HAHCH|nr:DNA recombination protein RmuC [Hahella chejuensis]ABC31660.1 uncharacterized protein conserved in bacteria [Hahella chejuensis KCTC 2396]
MALLQLYWPYLAAGGIGLAVALLALIGMMRQRRQRRDLELRNAQIIEKLLAREEEVARLQEACAEKTQRCESMQREVGVLQQSNAAVRARMESIHERYVQVEAAAKDKDANLSELTQALSAAQSELASLKTAAAKEQLHHQEKLKLLEASREALTQEFQLLANRIFESSTQKLSEFSQNNLKTILDPLNTQLNDFRKKVEDVYDKEAQQRFSLSAEIKKLQTLNERISDDAIKLTNALKGDNKAAGTWGEVILERILERSGLVKGREYEVQSAQRNEAGRRIQPDVIIRLPENKNVVVDSKVSLVAYEQYHNASDDSARIDYLKQHVLSVRQHIKGLSGKRYQDALGLNSLDFVLLFIPIEGAFAAAVQGDQSLFNEAFQLNVVIVSPSTLLATLRTIHNIWRYEHQSQNAQEIARQAGYLYDKFVNFVQDLEEVGQRLQQTQGAYDTAMGRLATGRGNLITRVEKLKQLGARAGKQLSESTLQRAQMSEEGDSRTVSLSLGDGAGL